MLARIVSKPLSFLVRLAKVDWCVGGLVCQYTQMYMFLNSQIKIANFTPVSQCSLPEENKGFKTIEKVSIF